MALIPPQPIGVLPGSGLWNDWIEKIRTVVNQTLTSINWSIITGKPTTVAGFGITDAVTTGTTLDSNRLILGNGSHDVVDLSSLGTTTTVLHGNAAGAPTFGAVVLTTDVSGVLPTANGGNPGGANPSASVGLAAVNGTATTFLRSDAAPALSQTITPTWTNTHTFTKSGDGLTGSAIAVSAARATIHIHESDAAANEGKYNIRAESGLLKIRIQDDAESADKDILSFDRTGNVVANLSFGNATDNPTFLFLGTAVPTHGSTTFLATTVALTNGAAAQVGTLTNAPALGNPTKWVPIDDNGTTRYIPCW